MADLRFTDRMSDMDALMWGIEKDPLLRSTIVAIAVLDQAPDRARLDRAHRPRQPDDPAAAPTARATDASRSRRPSGSSTRTSISTTTCASSTRPATGTMRDLLDLAAPIGMQGFDRARPLWEFFVVEGLEGGRAAMIQKVHHSVTDGVGGVEIALSMLDLEREPTNDLGPMPDAPEADNFSAIELMSDGIAHEVRRQRGIVSRFVGEVVKAVAEPAGHRDARRATSPASLARVLAPAFEPLSPIMTGRSLSARYDHDRRFHCPISRRPRKVAERQAQRRVRRRRHRRSAQLPRAPRRRRSTNCAWRCRYRFATRRRRVPAATSSYRHASPCR